MTSPLTALPPSSGWRGHLPRLLNGAIDARYTRPHDTDLSTIRAGPGTPVRRTMPEINSARICCVVLRVHFRNRVLGSNGAENRSKEPGGFLTLKLSRSKEYRVLTTSNENLR